MTSRLPTSLFLLRDRTLCCVARVSSLWRTSSAAVVLLEEGIQEPGHVGRVNIGHETVGKFFDRRETGTSNKVQSSRFCFEFKSSCPYHDLSPPPLKRRSFEALQLSQLEDPTPYSPIVSPTPNRLYAAQLIEQMPPLDLHRTSLYPATPPSHITLEVLLLAHRESSFGLPSHVTPRPAHQKPSPCITPSPANDPIDA